MCPGEGDGRERSLGTQALLGLRPTDGAAPLPGHEQSSGEQGWGHCTPRAGRDRCSPCSSAACLPLQAQADFTFISCQQTRNDGEYMGRFWARAKGGVIGQELEENLFALQACPVPGVMPWEAEEGKKSFLRHQT